MGGSKEGAAKAEKWQKVSDIVEENLEGTALDTLGGLTASQFLRSDANDNFTSGTLTTDSGTVLKVMGQLRLGDTDGSSTLMLAWNEDDTVERNLYLLVAGGDRSLTFNEDFTIGDGYGGTVTFSAASKTLTIEADSQLNQDLTTDASPTFAGATVNGDVTITGLVNGVDINNLSMVPGLTLTGTGNLTYSPSGSTLTVEADTSVDQDVTSDGSPTFNNLTLDGNLMVAGTVDGVDVSTLSGLTLNEDLTIGSGNSGTITFSGASKTLTVEDDSTVNQDLSSDASPTFGGLTINGNIVTSGDVDGVDISNLSGLTLNEDFTVGSGNSGTLTFSGASKTLTVEDDTQVNQDVTSDASPTFSSLSITGNIACGGTVDGVDISTLASGTTKLYDIDATAGNQTVNLDTAASIDGAVYIVKKTDSSNNTVTVDPNGAETINGASTYIIERQHEWIALQSDNTNWQIVGGPNKVMNVKWFGAVGDGVTDDSTAFQNCIDAAPSSSTVEIPDGNYVIGTTLSFTKRLSLRGHGWGTQLFMSADDHLLSIGSDATSVEFVRVEKLYLGSAATTSGKALLNLVRCSHSIFRDVYLLGGYYGIFISGGLCNRFIGCITDTSNNCFGSTSVMNRIAYIQRNGATATGSNNNSFIGCNLRGGANVAVDGIYFTQSAEGGINFTDCVIEGFTNEALYVTGTNTYVNCRGVHFESNSIVNLEGLTGGRIEGCYNGTTGAYSFVLKDCKNVVITNSYFTGVTADASCQNIEVTNNLLGDEGVALFCQPCKVANNEYISYATKSAPMYHISDRSSYNLVDGDLEVWTAGMPKGFSSYDTGTVTQESSIVKFGSYSAKVTSDVGGTKSGGIYKELDLSRYSRPQTFNYRSSAYSWTLSASGTNEYYLRTAASGDPEIEADPECVLIGGSVATAGTVGSLNAGEWDYGDNDSLGYSTIYVRLSGGGDPDAQSSGHVQGVLNRARITASAWVYKDASNDKNPQIVLFMDSSGDNIQFTEVPVEQWTKITATFNVKADQSSECYVMFCTTYHNGDGQIAYWDGIEIVEGTNSSPITNDSLSGNFSDAGVVTLPTYTDATRPTASELSGGAVIWNSDDGAPNYSDGSQWVDASGSPT